MTYELNISPITNTPCSVQLFNDNGSQLSIPLCQDNTDFCRFLIWNKRNDYPIEIPEEIMTTIDMALIEQVYGREV